MTYTQVIIIILAIANIALIINAIHMRRAIRIWFCKVVELKFFVAGNRLATQDILEILLNQKLIPLVRRNGSKTDLEEVRRELVAVFTKGN